MSRTWRVVLFTLGLMALALLLLDSEPSQAPQNSAALNFVTPTAVVVEEIPPTREPTSAPTGAVEPSPSSLTAAPISPINIQTTVHTVTAGDNIYRIAQAYDVSMDTLIALNNLTEPERIFAGQQLLVPAPGTDPALIPTLNPAAPPVQIVLQPTMTLVPTLTPPPPIALNSVPLDMFIVMPPDVQQHIREIYEAGQARGNNARVFTKIGDSIIEHPFFMGRFDESGYNLGPYAYLQDVIDHFAGSFGTPSVGVRRGLHSWTVLDPAWADKSVCQPNETVLACELRRSQPSIVFIKLGSNDVGIPERFETNMREIVAYAIDSGVIPVLSTKADRHEGPDNTNNLIIQRVAQDYRVPLWDFDRIAATIPGKGLEQDGIHLTVYYAHDYTSPTALQRGHGLHNLTGLMVLDRILRITNPNVF